MGDFGIEIKSARELGVKFQEFPDQARANIRLAIERQTATLLGRVRSAAPEDSGKLRSEISSRVYDDTNKITGRVFVGGDFSERSKRGSVAAGKAAALEYGAHSVAVVRAYTSKLDHIYSRFVTPFAVSVAGYQRRVTIAGDSYLRAPLRSMETTVTEAIRSAVAQAEEAS